MMKNKVLKKRFIQASKVFKKNFSNAIICGTIAANAWTI